MGQFVDYENDGYENDDFEDEMADFGTNVLMINLMSC
jgi:hypothetical protein